MPIDVTEKAIKEVKRIMEEQKIDPDKSALRLRVVGGGCSGFMTKLDIDESFDEKKDDLSVVDGVRVAVDKRSALYLEGATVDFSDDLNTRGFIVSNPNATGKCGCGSSWSM